MIDILYERLQYVHDVNLILATTTRNVDDPLADYAQSKNISVYRGSFLDVAHRLMSCANHFKLSHFCRINGDSPLADPDLINSMYDSHLSFLPDLTTNIFPRTYPSGLSVEVITLKPFLRAYPSFTPSDKEHVTQYFYSHPDEFHIKNFISDLPLSSSSVAVDDPASLSYVRRLLSSMESSHVSYTGTRLLMHIQSLSF